MTRDEILNMPAGAEMDALVELWYNTLTKFRRCIMPKLYQRNCDYCGKGYKGSSPNFCSRKCFVDSKWILQVCDYCKKKFQARKIYVNRGQMKYCSNKCSQLASRKNEVIQYGGDTFYLNIHGYFQSAITNNILHRVIWESHNGTIPDGYIVHHIDGDKTNNKIDNLELIKWGRHTEIHNRCREYKTTIPKLCIEEKCNRRAKARGLCTKHYQRLRAKERGYWI